jgi:hypothetical protein
MSKNLTNSNDATVVAPIRPPPSSTKSIELAYKCSLSKMIQLYCLVFIFGHVLFTVTGLLIQTQYISSRMLSLRRETLDLLVSLSLLFLYLSFSGNFLVYYQYNSLFRAVLTGDNDHEQSGLNGGLRGGTDQNNNGLNANVNGLIDEEQPTFLPD